MGGASFYGVVFWFECCFRQNFPSFIKHLFLSCLMLPYKSVGRKQGAGLWRDLGVVCHLILSASKGPRPHQSPPNHLPKCVFDVWKYLRE